MPAQFQAYVFGGARNDWKKIVHPLIVHVLRHTGYADRGNDAARCIPDGRSNAANAILILLEIERIAVLGVSLHSLFPQLVVRRAFRTLFCQEERPPFLYAVVQQ